MNRIEEVKVSLEWHKKQVEILKSEYEELLGNCLLNPYGLRVFFPYELTEKYRFDFPKDRSDTVVIKKVSMLTPGDPDGFIATVRFDKRDRDELLTPSMLKEYICE